MFVFCFKKNILVVCATERIFCVCFVRQKVFELPKSTSVIFGRFSLLDSFTFGSGFFFGFNFFGGVRFFNH